MKSNIYRSYDDLPLTLSAKDVQQALGISRAGTYQLLHSGELPVIHIGSRLLVPKDKFFSWLSTKAGANND